MPRHNPSVDRTDKETPSGASPSLQAQRWMVHGLHGVIGGLLGLHLYVATLPPTPTPIPGPGDPESLWWGLWPVTYVPGPWLLAGVGAVLATLVGGQMWVRGSRWLPVPGPSVAPWVLFGVAVLLVGAFFRYPIVHTRWGDAYILVHGLAWPDPEQRLTHSWQAPLDVWLHSRVWLWLHGPLNWDNAMPVYRLLSPLAGILYLGGVLRLSREPSLAPNWLTFGAMASLGLLQLFFGYVENYSFAAAGMVLYLGMGVGLLRGRGSLWGASAVLGLTVAFHPSTLVLVPSLLYLAWHHAGGRAGIPGRLGRALFQIGWPMALVLVGVVGMMEAGGHGIRVLLSTDRPGGGDARWFVPLFETTTRWERYTMFSWAHLRDFLNEQMLVAPGVLPGLVVAVWGLRREGLLGRVLQDPVGRFLLWAAAAHLALTWVWNPDYGGQRDWDLFSLAAIPTTLFFVWAVARALPTSRLRWAGLLPWLVLQGLHTAAWIYQNRLPWEWP